MEVCVAKEQERLAREAKLRRDEADGSGVSESVTAAAVLPLSGRGWASLIPGFIRLDSG